MSVDVFLNDIVGEDQKGVANGVAPLDGTSKVPAIYLPSYVDDVLEYADLASFPVTGETSKVYIALDTNKTYRWSGSTYVEVSPSDVNSVAGKTGIVTLDIADTTGLQTALDAKLPIQAGATTGTALTFVTDRIYGTISTPETGNITYSTTGAVVGVTNIIIHNSGTTPTFGANMKKLSGSGTYTINVINYIYVTYINATEVIYSIQQRS